MASKQPWRMAEDAAEYRRIQALGQTKRVELSATEHRVLWCIVGFAALAGVYMHFRFGWVF